MKFASLVFVTLVAHVVTDAVAQVQSDGFRLILKSLTDPTLDDHALGACHESAAHEALCPTNDTITTPARPYTTFYHNLTSYNHDKPKNAINTAGILNWPLSLNGGTSRISSAMYFYYKPGSNLVNMVFGPRDSGQPVYFMEGNNNMYIVVPYIDVDEDHLSDVIHSVRAENWYVCTTFSAYPSTSLVWKIGLEGYPQNTTCLEVEVRRVWV